MTRPIGEAGVGIVTAVEASAVIVDTRAYYKAFYAAAKLARRSILMCGWQFDTDAVLLRGADAEGEELPVTLLPFLSALCERRPELRIYVLAWDYSVAYAFEREWLQDWKFSLETPERVQFEFDTHPRPTGSRHEKYVIIDEALAFAGGADICDERWDDRDHAATNDLRTNALGEPARPNHEVQAFVTGRAAETLATLFRERWREVRGEGLEPSPPNPDIAGEFLRRTAGAEGFIPLSAGRVRVCRTLVGSDGAVERQILRAYEDAFAAAERVIYIETQYFTSRSITKALLDRLRARERTKLEVFVVLPTRGDSSKEEFAMGETQRMVLGALEEAARDSAHRIRFLCSAIEGSSETTFIHSKLLIVDDCFLAVGSANFTERSMGFDSELALVWEAGDDSALARDIRRVRASLLAEHAGRDASELERSEGLVASVDAWVLDQSSRLRACHFERVEPNVAKIRFFDPGGPAVLPADEAEPTSREDLERFARGWGRMMRELSERLLSRS
jgi:phospholipase D1/2